MSDAFLTALVDALNARRPDAGFRLRYFSSRDSTETDAATRRYVEPGKTEFRRESRGSPLEYPTARIVSEGFPASSAALEEAIVAERAFLRALARELVADPTGFVAGAFCLSARVFADAEPFYSPEAANDESPYLFAGLEASFFLT